ncbi:MAG: naringenin-chalcone synthase [Bdellovibrionaceae bacterium]|nr:naringenin-chalcone synthase [Pseudobdellovibrionaceae bacterium]
MFLSGLRIDRPPFLKSQTDALQWLSRAYLRANPQTTGLDRFLERVACRPPHIESRAHYSPAFMGAGDAELFPEVEGHPGAGTKLRMEVFARESRVMLDQLLQPTSTLAPHLLHVTCTGYVAPSPAELHVLERGAAAATTVTHLYHMGCYAAIPALRVAQGLTARGQDVDVIHTELCTLHLRPKDPTPERMVIESLFADGGATYRLSAQAPDEPHFEVLSVRQELLPDSAGLMAWVISENGMDMSLKKEVPKHIQLHLRDFQLRWLKELGLSLSEFQASSFAVHPGGPRIIDQVKETLELPEEKLTHSRRVLRERGNMSSATLPQIWTAMLNEIPDGERVFSYAFGPGLTVAAALLQKRGRP